tara:strand:+ start:860 stop:1477 length:618 start_codon:yes stop_codon:yes gene_type:complete
MPQLDLSGSLSKISCDKLASQSGTTVELTAGHKITNFASTGIDDNASGATAISIDANEIVTMPKQPCFLASNSGVQTNVTGNGATHTMVWGTETFDLNADFDGTTFTAPVTGKYLISASLHFQQVTAAADQVQLGIVTSNKAFTSVIAHVNGWGTEPEAHKTVLCDMDAADTFTITCRIAGESSDIVDVTAGANGYTYVSCALIA